MVVAYADDLDSAVQHIFEILDHGRGELDGPLLSRDVRRVGVTNKPVLAAVDPHIHVVLENDFKCALCGIGGKHVLLHDGHVGLDEDPAVESGNRGSQS